MGTTKRPVYRLVVADSRSPRDGRFIESIGFYDPLPNPAVVRIDAERVQLWIKRGARPSDSARQLLVKEGILAARPFKVTIRPEPEPAAAAAPQAPAAAAVAEEPAVAAAEEPAAAVAAEPEVATTTQDDATASPADEPANDEESSEPVDSASAAQLPEAGGDAGGSPDAQEARRGGAPATTGPAVADDAEREIPAADEAP
jgi:small subunit ribosomal protein S16